MYVKASCFEDKHFSILNGTQEPPQAGREGTNLNVERFSHITSLGIYRIQKERGQEGGQQEARRF